MDKRPFRTTRRIANLREGRNDWYRIKNSAGTGDPSLLHIYDEIGFFGVTAQDLIRDLAAAGGDLEVHMNCPGGDVFEGVAIYNALKQRKGTVGVVVDGLAASAASFIAQAASPGKLVIAKNASMMIHDAFGMGIGNAADMRQLADLLDAQSTNIAGIYADRSGKPVEHWREQMRAETWYVGPEAVDAGLADTVQGSASSADMAVAASFDLSIFRRQPAVQDAAPSPVDPDGDGDDDSTPEGDTDHDYWDEAGNQIQDLPGRPMDAMKPPFDLAAPSWQAVEQARAIIHEELVASGLLPGPDGFVRPVNAEKYNTEDRKKMAGKEAMDDGSYPIADAEDLGNAIHAVGRGGADHDAIRKHIIKRADALGLSSKIPDNWNSDGSLKEPGAENHADPGLVSPAEPPVAAGVLELTDEMLDNIRAALEEAQQ